MAHAVNLRVRGDIAPVTQLSEYQNRLHPPAWGIPAGHSDRLALAAIRSWLKQDGYLYRLYVFYVAVCALLALPFPAVFDVNLSILAVVLLPTWTQKGHLPMQASASYRPYTLVIYWCYWLQ